MKNVVIIIIILLIIVLAYQGWQNYKPDPERKLKDKEKEEEDTKPPVPTTPTGPKGECKQPRPRTETGYTVSCINGEWEVNPIVQTEGDDSGSRHAGEPPETDIAYRARIRTRGKRSLYISRGLLEDMLGP